MTHAECGELRQIVAQLFKLADRMEVNIQPTQGQCAALRELAQRMLKLTNERFSGD